MKSLSILLIIFLCGCSIHRVAIDLSALSKNTTALVTNEVKTAVAEIAVVSKTTNGVLTNSIVPAMTEITTLGKSINHIITNDVAILLEDVHTFISKDLKLAVNDLHDVSVNSVSLISNLNVQSTMMFSNISLRTDITLDKIDKTLDTSEKIAVNINNLTITANKLITRLNEKSEDLSYSLPKWAERIRVILEVLLGVLAIYAFRKNKIDDDVKNLYKKSTMKMQSFFK